MGREDRETIVCTHTMDGHSFLRHWPVIKSRLAKAGLAIVPGPAQDRSDIGLEAEGGHDENR
jgi:hypothetical protein